MIELNLEKIKDEYQNTKLPQYLIYNGWADLKFKLPEKQNHFWKINIGRGIIFASTCILITTFLLAGAQASKPGDALFPVKIFSEDIRATITGNYQQKIENRAQDILDLSTKSQDKLDQAIEKYQQTVKESLEKTKDDQKYNDLNKSIERHNQEIKKIEEKGSNYSNNEENNRSNTEIKGQKSSNSEYLDLEKRSEQKKQTEDNEHDSEESDTD